MAQVVLLFPHTGCKRPQEYIMPLALLYIAAPLVADGYSVRIIDQRKTENWEEELGAAVKEDETLCVGISTMTGHQIRKGMEMAGAVRELAPALPIVWGGVHPSLLPEQTIESEWVDAVVVGEGEETFLELVRSIEIGEPLEGVEGICYKRRGQAILTGRSPSFDLNKMSPLPYHLLDVKDYLINPLRTKGQSLPIITSRGCPSRCGYCYNVKFNCRLWKPISPQKVVEEIKYLVDSFGVDGVFLLDDNFFVDKKRVIEILLLLESENLRVNIHNANCRVDYLAECDEKFLEMLRRGGVRQLFVGVESGSDEVLRGIRKDITVEQVHTVNRKLKAADIIPVYSFMAGFSFEGVEDVKQTLGLMTRLADENPHALFYKLSLYTPYPGTELYELCLEEGMSFPESLEGWADFSYDRVNLSLLDRKKSKFLKKASLLSGFIDVKGKLNRSNRVLEFLLARYSKLIRFRCRRSFFHFMPELYLAEQMRKLQEAD